MPGSVAYLAIELRCQDKRRLIGRNSSDSRSTTVAALRYSRHVPLCPGKPTMQPRQDKPTDRACVGAVTVDESSGCGFEAAAQYNDLPALHGQRPFLKRVAPVQGPLINPRRSRLRFSVS